MNKKINLDLVLKDLTGAAIPLDAENSFTMGKALANMLITAKTGGKMKLYSLAQKAYGGGEVEVDAADFDLINGIVKSSDFYSALITGQIETILAELK